MKTLMALALLSAMALVVPATADAVDLVTAPLSDDLSAGTVRCVVTNVNTTLKAITVSLVDVGGNNIVGGITGVNLGPGATTQTASIDLASTDPAFSHCRCTVPNKKFRCSMVYVRTSETDPPVTTVTVVPGQ
jgi:hypothetical protein